MDDKGKISLFTLVKNYSIKDIGKEIKELEKAIDLQYKEWIKTLKKNDFVKYYLEDDKCWIVIRMLTDINDAGVATVDSPVLDPFECDFHIKRGSDIFRPIKKTVTMGILGHLQTGEVLIRNDDYFNNDNVSAKLLN